jgi:alpha-ribazole phosphatase
MNVILIRHLELLIEPGICYGRLDIAPDPAAESKAHAVAAHPALSDVTQVWSSPALRCRSLAVTIALAAGVPLHVDARLQELDFGQWEGKSWDAIDRAALDLWAASPLTFAPPRGESGAALMARVEEFHRHLRREGQNCAVVSHGGPLKILGALLSGAPVDLFAAAPSFGSVAVWACPPISAPGRYNRPW